MSSETLALEVRPAAEADALMLWAWANDHGVRRASFHDDWIPWDSHAAWFAARLHDPASRLYVVEVHKVRSTQLGFEHRPAAA